jgi:hypothetical protein
MVARRLWLFWCFRGTLPHYMYISYLYIIKHKLLFYVIIESPRESTIILTYYLVPIHIEVLVGQDIQYASKVTGLVTIGGNYN